MKIGSFATDEKVFVVAEIGNNHEGDFTLAQEMIDLAAEAGADAVKFQTFVPELYVSSEDAARLERLRRFRLTTEQFEGLAKHASAAGLLFFSTPFDLESARFLNTIQSVFKISSGDNTFFPLIETVAQFGKPIILSTGLADMDLLERVTRDIRAISRRNGIDADLALLHCVSSYPVPPAQANLGAIRALIERFPDCTIGYSDHTLGIEAATYAVAAGARIVEKHFTHNKRHSDFRDHQLSADPTDMRRLVEAIRSVTAMMGVGEKVPQACERELAVAVRRSIAAATDMAAGAVISRSNIVWVRPGTGIAPGEEAQVLGRRLRRALKSGELIQQADLAE